MREIRIPENHEAGKLFVRLMLDLSKLNTGIIKVRDNKNICCDDDCQDGDCFPEDSENRR